ncbi:MAG: hypothetical protein NZ602_00500 [Thermoguttaceae bacterium]|nr:hypothetical protein [Thermoguttaceae bacterium]MDW8036431.1 (Fe-S)-binding protein [Thermoguttaceae bacterium]
MQQTDPISLPGLNCGLCGYRSCEEFQKALLTSPELIGRCVHLSKEPATCDPPPIAGPAAAFSLEQSSADLLPEARSGLLVLEPRAKLCWKDSLGREFDFYLEHFPEEPGPREIILPHNPLITRELEVQIGDILIGRPLGMSCGCPITHCGVAMQVDRRTGLIVWCVTGPLGPRQKGYKDLGYYIAEAYEGLVYQCRTELKVGMRYFFQPRLCMLQWRHSGLLNYLCRQGDSFQVRLEGLWIG